MWSPPDSLVFWLFVPGLFLVLAFGWLVYLSRGKRTTRFSISGLGMAVTFSTEEDMDKKGNVKDHGR